MGLIDTNYKARIGFVHVPKNGGSTFCETVKPFISGHVSLACLKIIESEVPYFALARNPIDRFESMVNFMLEYPSHCGVEKVLWRVLPTSIFISYLWLGNTLVGFIFLKLLRCGPLHPGWRAQSSFLFGNLKRLTVFEIKEISQLFDCVEPFSETPFEPEEREKRRKKTNRKYIATNFDRFLIRLMYWRDFVFISPLLGTRKQLALKFIPPSGLDLVRLFGHYLRRKDLASPINRMVKP